MHPLPRDPKAYLGAAKLLDLQPQEVALVAAHQFDLEAAARLGMSTIFIRRKGVDVDPWSVKSKAEGGKFDVVVDSLVELAEVLKVN